MARAEYAHLYKTAAWQKRRRAQLDAEPVCALCERQGYVTAATVADHVIPHRGDEALFFTGELQSLCDRHHAEKTAREEGTGAVRSDKGLKGCDAEGNPLDPSAHWA